MGPPPGIKLCFSPDSQCVDGIKDICLCEVEDDVSVEVPNFQNALFVAPEEKLTLLCDFDALKVCIKIPLRT